MFGAALTVLLAISGVAPGLVVQTNVITGSAKFGTDVVDFKISMPNPCPANAGLNVFLHEDGGGSYDIFPNSAFKNNLIGVILQAPNGNRTWGGNRDNAMRASANVSANFPDGVKHSNYIDQMLKSGGSIETKMGVKFDHTKIFFTGASGGSLLLTGFFVPMFANKYQSGALLMCGGMPRQVPVTGGAYSYRPWRLAYQSTQDELWQFKQTIPASIHTLEADAYGAGGGTAEINSQYTFGALPSGGGHCGLDGVGLHSGIQFGVDNFGAIMGMGGVIPASLHSKGIVGNEYQY